MNSRLPISVVILTCNEAGRIENCVSHARLLTDDVIVVDSGSADNTVDIVSGLGCRVLLEGWNGYGNNKNRGIKAARYDWILSLDADESPDFDLIRALQTVDFSDPAIVYNIPFKIFFGQKAIRFGSFGKESHIRLFNRTKVKWEEVPVHETLMLDNDHVTKRLNGHINHYAIQSPEQYRQKMVHYAALNARKYLLNGKKATVIKRFVSPVFNFVKNYIFRLGIMDGKNGFFIAVTMAWYTWLKYQNLHKMQSTQITRSAGQAVSHGYQA